MFEPSSRYFYSLISYDSFSDPARSTMLSFDEIIGHELSYGLHSSEMRITAWDLELNSLDTVDDIVHFSFPAKMIFSASAALWTSISFRPGTWIPLLGSSIITS